MNPWLGYITGMALMFAGVAGLQTWRLNEVQDEYQMFVAQTKAAGLAAEQQAKNIEQKNALAKTESDAAYTSQLVALRDDNERLRKQRADTCYLPKASTASKSPDRICFDRAKLERGIQQLDAGLSEIVSRCADSDARLSVTKDWFNKIDQ